MDKIKQIELTLGMRLLNFIGDDITVKRNFHDYDFHKHNEYEFHYIIEGQGIFNIDKNLYHVKSGSFLLCPPNTIHSFISEHGLRQLIFFAPSDAFNNWPQLSNKVLLMELDHSFERDYELIRRDSLSDFPEKITGAFYTVLGLLLRNCNTTGSPRSSLVLQLQEYLEKNNITELHIYNIAENLGVSHAYLIRLFKNETGMTPKKYQQKYRIDKSCYYLLTTNYSINEISKKVGFEDSLYFSRVFRKTLGISPAQWRTSTQC